MTDRTQGAKRSALETPDLALADYLDALLAEVESLAEADVASVAEPPARGEPVVSASAAAAELPPVPSVEPPAAAPAEAIPLLARPSWASAPFQCLLVKMAGLKVAIPLALLDSIATWHHKMTHLPGQPAWHLGLMEHRGAKVTLVDTALLVMPEKAGSMPAQERIRDATHVLIVGGGRWGLLCDRLLNPLMLDPVAVRWRDARGNSPWMVGTLPQQLCILLDVDVLLRTIGHE